MRNRIIYQGEREIDQVDTNEEDTTLMLMLMCQGSSVNPIAGLILHVSKGWIQALPGP